MDDNVYQQHTKPLTPWNNFKKHLHRKLQKKYNKYRGRNCFVKGIYGVFPIVDYLVHYNVKKWLIGDIFSGFTVGVMGIPQGMAYGILAGVDPIYGLYASFFPVLTYSFLCTSLHASVSPFVATSIISGKIVRSVGADQLTQKNSSSRDALFSNHSASGEQLSDQGIPMEVRIELMMAVTLSSGIWLILMGVFRFGHLAVFLSDYLVKGITCACSIHIATAQVKLIFGMPQIPERNGPLKLIYFYQDFFNQITRVHVATLVVALISLTFLFLVRVFINQNQRIRKVMKFPVPSELLLIIFATVASHYMDLNDSWGVKTMGAIPTTFPTPRAPSLYLIPTMIGKTFNLAVVEAAVLLTLAKIFARKKNYKIDPNQELIALGAANILGSFFFCVPATGALARSAVQEAVGGSTQLVSLIAAMVMLIVLLGLGRFLEDLPRACVGAIIIITILNMMKQVVEIRRLWQKSLIDLSIFVVTLLAILLLDLDLGLAVSISYSLLIFAFRMQYGRVVALGRMRGSPDDLKPLREPMVNEISGVQIYRLYGPFYFVNAEKVTLKIFRGIMKKDVTLNASAAFALELPEVSAAAAPEAKLQLSVITNGQPLPNTANTPQSTKISKVNSVIIDFSCTNFIDLVGAESMVFLAKECQKVNVKLMFAGCVDNVRNVLVLAGVLEHVASNNFIRSVADGISN